jgi:hypothetical protein
MKTQSKIFVILFVLLSYSCLITGTASAQPGYVSFQVFYDQLNPYGQWVDYPNYGYVWIPDVGPDFTPYSTAGYWVMTEYGWTWVSDYEWGWATFHYGRWDYDNYYGWFWVPDNEWGPSWVTWRRSNGYYGWTPMRPGISISVSFGGGYRDVDRWIFVRDRDFGRPDIGRYYVNRNENNVIIRNSTVINNTYIDNSRNTTYIVGPPRDDVQKVTGRRISNVTIRDNDKPGTVLKNDQLQIYRPRVEQTKEGNRRPEPSRVVNLKDVKPARERNTSGRGNNVTPTENNRRENQLPVQPQQQQTPPQQQQRREPQQQQTQPQKQQTQPQKQQTQPQQQQRREPQQQQTLPQQQQRREPQQQQKPEQQQVQPQKQQKQVQVQQQIEKQKVENSKPSDTKRRDQLQKVADPTDKSKKKEPDKNS